ncbi:hypothetical protein LBMAG48_15520 [Phycisphaerae bacterium]|jgi:hypothetical protein|nr:hypothetical protein LBMAG48_15520 [Phycisphaerae bacterium]
MDDEAPQQSKVKIIVVVVAVVLIVCLLIAGIFLSAPSGQTTPVGGGGGTQQTQTTPPEQQQLATLTSIAVDTAIDVVRFGPTLPFGVNASMGADIETAGATIVRGKVEMAAPDGGAALIEKLADVDNQTWVMLPIQPNHKRSLLGRSVATAQRVLIPLLNVDGVGQVQPLGFAYLDGSRRVLMVEPEFGLRALSQTPELFESRTDQKLWLLYRVPSGSYITGLFLGKRQVAEWVPPLAVK